MNYEVKNIYKKTNGKTVRVSVPGSKSITARAMLISAISRGTSTLYNAQYSDDCATFLKCLENLGIGCIRQGNTLHIEGCGGKLSKKSAELNVGSAGTAARFLPAFLAFQDGEYFLDCSPQMKKRPIAPLIEALKSLGARFEFLNGENCYPFIIKGARNANTCIEVDISKSSQYLSALLISAVCAGRKMKICANGEHGADYIHMTENIMWSFGADVKECARTYEVEGEYSPKRYHIEPDVSGACYFYAMNKILGTDVCVDGLMPHSMQGDMKFIDLIKNFDGGKVDMSDFSDQALTLAAIAPYLDNPTEICNVRHIRGQECDRIKAIVKNLTAMGVECEEREDGVKIYPSQPHGAHVDTFGDHRVAMSFAVTGLRADGIIIDNAEVCSKTFGDFFEKLDFMTQVLTED